MAALTLAALACLVLISVTGFASGSHPAGPPSHASSRAAPAATAPSAGTATPSATPSVRPDASTSSPSAVKDTVTTPPGLRHHKKGHGYGNGNSQ